MRAISAGEMTRKRSAVAPKRDKTATLKRPTYTTDSQGGYTDTLSTVGTYSCRVAPGAPFNFPTEMELSEAMKATSIWNIGLPYSTTVQTKDIIEVDSYSYEVLGQQGGKTNQTETRVICLRME